MSNVTELKHYTNYPVCGFCTTAWDVIYGRVRSATSPGTWVGYCRWGGCDPDVWDHVDESTGWPTGWKLNNRGLPICYEGGKRGKLTTPKPDNRCFHRRDDNSTTAPWRKNGNALRNQVEKRRLKLKGMPVEEIEWDLDEPEELVETPAAGGSWADDDDLWG